VRKGLNIWACLKISKFQQTEKTIYTLSNNVCHPHAWNRLLADSRRQWVSQKPDVNQLGSWQQTRNHSQNNNFWFLTSGGIKKTKPLRRSESSDTNFGFFHLKKVYCISNSYRKLAKMKVRKIFLLGL